MGKKFIEAKKGALILIGRSIFLASVPIFLDCLETDVPSIGYAKVAGDLSCLNARNFFIPWYRLTGS